MAPPFSWRCCLVPAVSALSPNGQSPRPATVAKTQAGRAPAPFQLWNAGPQRPGTGMRVRHYLSTHHNHSLACPWIRPPTSRTVTHWTVHAAPRCGHVRWQRPRPHANGAYAPVSLSSQLDLVLAKSQAHCCGASRVPAARTNDSWLPTERGQCMASAGSTRWSRGPGGGSPCSHARDDKMPSQVSPVYHGIDSTSKLPRPGTSLGQINFLETLFKVFSLNQVHRALSSEVSAIAQGKWSPEDMRLNRTGKHLVQEANSELTPEERRVLERKLKKERKKEEKKRLREAGIAAAQTAKGQTLPAKPSAAVLALEYLQGWAQKQESWRFQKTRQTWLLMNMYDEDKVPDEHFSTLLDYLEGLKGSARELTVQKAEALMQELDEADTETRDTQLGKMERLRQVLQLLS
ncbi:hypothetical protein NN561_012669 [Cricetulus griseus]